MTRVKLPEEERLVMLIEECGEVVQAATKILRFGYESSYDDGIVNRLKLEREIGDVCAVLALMLDAGDIDSRRVETFSSDKQEKIKTSPYILFQRRDWGMPSFVPKWVPPVKRTQHRSTRRPRLNASNRPRRAIFFADEKDLAMVASLVTASQPNATEWTLRPLFKRATKYGYGSLREYLRVLILRGTIVGKKGRSNRVYYSEAKQGEEWKAWYR
jgi:NTP pyrophosphatase (non-canonical NTP hydrolase)